MERVYPGLGVKILQLTAAGLTALSLMGGGARSRPVDLSAPGGEVGAANAKGYLEIWREIDGAGIDFGPGSYLPLRYQFSSDPATGGVLGPGFYVPMLEVIHPCIEIVTHPLKGSRVESIGGFMPPPTEIKPGNARFFLFACRRSCL